jgi:hypothetical protein
MGVAGDPLEPRRAGAKDEPACRNVQNDQILRAPDRAPTGETGVTWRMVVRP